MVSKQKVINGQDMRHAPTFRGGVRDTKPVDQDQVCKSDIGMIEMCVMKNLNLEKVNNIKEQRLKNIGKEIEKVVCPVIEKPKNIEYPTTTIQG